MIPKEKIYFITCDTYGFKVACDEFANKRAANTTASIRNKDGTGVNYCVLSLEEYIDYIRWTLPMLHIDEANKLWGELCVELAQHKEK